MLPSPAMDVPAQRFDRRVGVAVFLFSLGLLLYELCLTRVLSVFFYYHTAFLAVSLAMLGVGAGGVWVYLLGPRIGRRGMGGWMLAGGLAVVGLPLLLTSLHFDQAQMNTLWRGKFLLVFVPVALACLVPFLIGGVVWAHWFRAYRQDAPALYGWDLLGAALGALLLVPVMHALGGPGALLASSAVLLVASAWGARCFGRRRLAGLAGASALAVAVLLGVQLRTDLLAMPVATQHERTRVLFKRWNAFSRVALLSERRLHRGMSEARYEHWRGKLPAERAALIDINAFAPLIAFDGDLSKVRYLRELVSNFGHHLLPPGQDVAVLGPGGGKDVLGALLFSPRRIVGIEINPILVHDVVRDHSRRFTGDIYRHPKVEIRVGDARAELQRMHAARFGLIVANSVATFAAHSSGALNVTEQSLYTAEACGLYLDRLTPTGVLSVSLWDDAGHPLALRWIETCRVAARERGITKLAEHVAVVSARWQDDAWFTSILIARAPLSAAQRARLRTLSERWGYALLYAPGHTASLANFSAYFRDPAAFVGQHALHVGATSDDRPFFLYTSRWQDVRELFGEDAREDNVALVNLLLSLALVCGLLIVVIGLPLALHVIRRRTRCSLRARDIVYFMAIGLGFMFVEIPLIQRLTLFLGHPTYALTVVVAGLLLYSGIGALLAGRWTTAQSRSRWRPALLLLGGLLALLWLGIDALLAATLGWPTSTRIVVALLLLAPFGLCMGLPLPLAMVELGEREPAGIPWAWAINGASSVVASVAALLLALSFGFRAVLLVALGCYALAALALGRSSRALR